MAGFVLFCKSVLSIVIFAKFKVSSSKSATTHSGNVIYNHSMSNTLECFTIDGTANMAFTHRFKSFNKYTNFLNAIQILYYLCSFIVLVFPSWYLTEAGFLFPIPKLDEILHIFSIKFESFL